MNNMEKLLTDYLSESEAYNFGGVEIVNFQTSGNLCHVEFLHYTLLGETKEKKELNLWDVLAFVNSKKTTIIRSGNDRGLA